MPQQSPARAETKVQMGKSNGLRGGCGVVTADTDTPDTPPGDNPASPWAGVCKVEESMDLQTSVESDCSDWKTENSHEAFRSNLVFYSLRLRYYILV